jgi:hypothetical protein
MKTIDELKKEHEAATVEAEKLWEVFKAAEKSRPVDPVKMAENAWHTAYVRQEDLARAIKLLSE